MDSTIKFQEIAKAYEVLKGNESRPLFDYYLDHPWDYFKVSGRHMMRSMPKVGLGVVAVGVLAFLSVVLYYVQLNNYKGAKKYLEDAVLKNLGPKNGGSKYTVDLFDSIADKYNSKILEDKPDAKNSNKRSKHPNNQKVSKSKMLEDPAFHQLVKEVVDAVEIDGGNKKPTFDDLLVVRLLKLPLSLGKSSATQLSEDQADYYKPQGEKQE